MTPSTGPTASQRLDQRIADLGDWRGATLQRVRELIHAAVPGVEETWKWMGTPVFEHRGILCTGETYKAVVKLTFAKGASLPDPAHLFNSSLDGNVRRAIDIREGERIDAAAFTALLRAAAAHNETTTASRAKPRPQAKKQAKTQASTRGTTKAAKRVTKQATKAASKHAAKRRAR